MSSQRKEEQVYQELGEALMKIMKKISEERELTLEGDLATEEMEKRLTDLGYKVIRNNCPVLLRKRLTVSIT